MLLNEYYERGNKVFSNLNSEFFPTQQEEDILNFLFNKRYGNMEMYIEDPSEVSYLVMSVSFIRDKYYKAVSESLGIVFDPLNTVDIEEVYNDSKEGTTARESEIESTSNSSSTVTPNITTTNTPNTSIDSKDRTFDNDTLETTSQTVTTGTDTTTQTGNTQTQGNVTNNETLNQLDTHGEQTEGTRIRKGHDSIDYRKAIADLYETKKINLYEIFMKDVSEELLIPLYIF